MGGIQVAEAKPKRGPKVLDRLELKSKLGGGHVVRHIYSDYAHEPDEVQFNENGKREGKGGGEHIVDHLIKHAGLPAPNDEEE